MIKLAVWGLDLSDSYLKKITQLGADAVDGVTPPNVPGENYPDLDELLKIKKKIHSWGLSINRVSLPSLSPNYMNNKEGSDAELDNCSKALRVYGEAGCPVIRVSFAFDTYPEMSYLYEGAHRGGYHMRGESIAQAAPNDGPPPQEILDARWQQVCKFYERMVPIAEEYNVNLAMHPSDTPLGDTLFGGLGLHRLIDAFPSPNVGYLYCCGTRAEAGGSALVLDEINHYGRKGRLFEIHFRNVRGSLPTAGGFEEVLLDDGDMNMFKILQALHQVGFDGYLNPDHVPTLEGDDTDNGQGLAYSVGYIKALLAALAAN